MDDYQREEAEYLRKRAWDFIGKVEKLESQFNQTTDADKRKVLALRLKNNRRLLDSYLLEYKTLCEQAGIGAESLIPVQLPDQDIVSEAGRKTLDVREKLERRQDFEVRPFFEVPSRNPKFTGRRREVRAFIERVLSGGAFTICGVKGMGGIGKSEIAKEVCHLFHQTWQRNPSLPEYVQDLLGGKGPGHFPDGILWLQFEPEHQTPKSLVESIIAKLIDPVLQDKIAGLDGLVEVLKHKKILIVLDSVEQNLRTFDYVLERLKGKFSLIITSRIAIPGIEAVDINMLSDDEAMALFVNHLEDPVLSEDNRPDAAELCRMVGNHPLGITILASRVAADHGNLAQLKAEYRANSQLLLDERSPDRGIEARNAAVRTCFSMSYSCLDAWEQKVFLHSGLFNNPFTVTEIAALFDQEEADLGPVVRRLVRQSMVNRLEGKADEANTYALHPLMREFALNLLMDQVETVPGKQDKIRELLQSLQQLEKESRLRAGLLDPDLLHQVMDAVSYCDQVFDFAGVLDFMTLIDNDLSSVGHFDCTISLNQMGIRAAVALQKTRKECRFRIGLGFLLVEKASTLSEFYVAEQQLLKVLPIAKQTKNFDQYFYCKYQLADIRRERGDFTSSLANSYQGLRESSEHEDLQEFARYLAVVAAIYNQFLAIDVPTIHATRIGIKKGHKGELRNLILAYHDLIDVLEDRIGVAACIPHRLRLLDLAQTLNEKQLLISINEGLFLAHLFLQDAGAAARYFSAYREICRSLGFSLDQQQLRIAQFSWLKGDYQDAVQVLSSNLKEDALDWEWTCFWLGKAHLYGGNLQEAKPWLEKAHDIFQTKQDVLGLVQVFVQLAFLALKSGDGACACFFMGVMLKTKEHHDLVVSPEEKGILGSIKAYMRKKENGLARMDQLLSQAHPIVFKPGFLLEGLPLQVIGADARFMQLVGGGTAVIGPGQIDGATPQELIDHVASAFFPYRNHGSTLTVPPHPDHNFEDDHLLFLLMHSPFSVEEAQAILNKIPSLPGEEVKQIVRDLDSDYRHRNAMAMRIYLYPFYMDRDLVSNGEYQVFCQATRRSFPPHWPSGGVPIQLQSLPVVNVTLEDAKAYADWAGKALPTAPEWEKACRGVDGLLFPWGNEWDETRVCVGRGDVRMDFEAVYSKLNPGHFLQGGQGRQIQGQSWPAELERIYEALNAAIPKDGGLVHFPEPRLALAPHQLSLDAAFLSYLQGSLSLSLKEKVRISQSLSILSQKEVDQLFEILRTEKVKFLDVPEAEQAILGVLRKKCFLELMNHEVLAQESDDPDLGEQPGVLQFKQQLFKLPPHELQLNDEAFVSWLQGSLSLTADEKRRIVEALPRLTQYQVDELLNILQEEKLKFQSLEVKHDKLFNQLRRKIYMEMMQPELEVLYMDAMQCERTNANGYGITELVGRVYQMTLTRQGDGFLIKGGSWFSQDPETECQGWASQVIKPGERRLDVGFRCVKPVFSPKDVPGAGSDASQDQIHQ